MLLLYALRAGRYLLRGMLEPKLTLLQPVTTRVYVGFRMVDIFFHVNNTQFIQIYEFARWHWCGRIRGLSALFRCGSIPVVTSCHVMYMRQMPPFQCVRVTTRVIGNENDRLLCEQRIESRSGTLYSVACFRMALIDRTGTRKGALPACDFFSQLSDSVGESEQLAKRQGELSPHMQELVRAEDVWRNASKQQSTPCGG